MVFEWLEGCLKRRSASEKQKACLYTTRGGSGVEGGVQPETQCEGNLVSHGERLLPASDYDRRDFSSSSLLSGIEDTGKQLSARSDALYRCMKRVDSVGYLEISTFPHSI